MRYPAARRDTHSEVIFGRTVSDPYRWLEDGQSDEVLQWSLDQDALWQEHISSLSGRSYWNERLRQLLSAGYQSPPTWRGHRQFFMRRRAEDEMGILYTKKDLDSPAEVQIGRAHV